MTIRPALRGLAAERKNTAKIGAMVAVMVTLLALLGVQAKAAGPADGPEKSERIRQLMRINGFEFQISKAPETLAVQLRSQQERSGLNQDEHAFVVEVILEAFNPADFTWCINWPRVFGGGLSLRLCLHCVIAR